MNSNIRKFQTWLFLFPEMFFNQTFRLFLLMHLIRQKCISSKWT